MRRLAAGALLLAACASKPDAPPAAAPKPDPQIAALQTSMTELLERLDVMNDRIAKLEKANEEPASVAPATSPARAAGVGGATPRPPAPLKSADIANLYRTAITQYGQGRLAEARNAFQRVFESDPSGDLADNALFWIGETYYTGGNYNEAIRYYKRVADEYGDQNKAPDALYMLALAYEKTSDLALARTTLQQVIARYPYSAPAASAKSELNRIKY